MRAITYRICVVLLCVFLGLLYSCESNDSPDPYTQSLQNNSNNLNMKGEPPKKTNPDDIARIQSDLESLGYDPGQVDGTYGPQMRRAIKRFQQEHGIHTDGAAGALTEQAILKAIHARKTLQNNTPKSIQPQQESNP